MCNPNAPILPGTRVLSTALKRIAILHGMTDADMGRLAERDADTIERARNDRGDTGVDGIMRLSRALVKNCGALDIAYCALPEDGWQIVKTGGTADGTMDDDWAALNGAIAKAHAAHASGNKAAALVALSIARAELDDLVAEASRLA